MRQESRDREPVLDFRLGAETLREERLFREARRQVYNRLMAAQPGILAQMD